MTAVAEFEVAWVYKDSNKLIKISRFILKSMSMSKYGYCVMSANHYRMGQILELPIV